MMFQEKQKVLSGRVFEPDAKKKPSMKAQIIQGVAEEPCFVELARVKEENVQQDLEITSLIQQLLYAHQESNARITLLLKSFAPKPSSLSHPMFLFVFPLILQPCFILLSLVFFSKMNAFLSDMDACLESISQLLFFSYYALARFRYLVCHEFLTCASYISLLYMFLMMTKGGTQLNQRGNSFWVNKLGG